MTAETLALLIAQSVAVTADSDFLTARAEFLAVVNSSGCAASEIVAAIEIAIANNENTESSRN